MKERKGLAELEQELKKRERAFEDKKTYGIPHRLLAAPRMRMILWFAAAVLLGGCAAAMAGCGMLTAEGQWPVAALFFLAALISVWNGLQYRKKSRRNPEKKSRNI